MGTNLYTNTIVFSIVAGVVSLILLLMIIYVPSTRGFVYGIATIEIGMVAVIITAIVQISNYENNLKKVAAQGANYLISVDTCPDYFSNTYQIVATDAATAGATTAGATTAAGATTTATTAGTTTATDATTPTPTSGVVCTNGYTSPTGDKTYYFVKQGCNAENVDDASCKVDSALGTKGFNVALNGFTNTTPTTVCTTVNSAVASSGYANVPWTDVKSRCNSLAAGGFL